MYTVQIREHFDAAHYLEGYSGKCAKLHGHRWVVEVVFLFQDDDLGKNKHGIDGKPVEGMLTDFGDLEAALRIILPDHQNLNDLFDFNPTAENLAKYLSDLITRRHEKVTVWETPDCGTSYYPDPERFELENRKEVDLSELRANIKSIEDGLKEDNKIYEQLIEVADRQGLVDEDNEDIIPFNRGDDHA